MSTSRAKLVLPRAPLGMTTWEMPINWSTERELRDRFTAGDQVAHTHESLLELLLSYAIPQKDVRRLAGRPRGIWRCAGSFGRPPKDLCRSDGIKEYSDSHQAGGLDSHPRLLPRIGQMDRTKSVPLEQPSLFPEPQNAVAGKLKWQKLQWAHRNAAGLFPRGTQLFGKAI